VGLVGDTAIMFASFRFKEVLALEPVADNYNCMIRNLERNHQYLNDTIKPLNVAVSNVSGELSMMKVGDDGVGSCVVEDEQSDIKVQSVTIDSLTFEDRVGLIKFDIEGYEINALNGAIETIKKHKPVLLISVYHLWLQPEQIFECKKFVENLNMGYQFKLFTSSLSVICV
jgi:FkbM family methyltransferase